MLPFSVGRKRRTRFNLENRCSSSNSKLKRSDVSESSAAEASQKACKLPRIRPISDPSAMRQYFQAMRLIVYLNAVLSGVAVFLAAWENEFTALHGYTQSWLADMMRGLVLALSALQLTLIRKYYHLALRTQIARGHVESATKLKASRLMGLEVVVTSICTPPLVYCRFTLPQSGFECVVSLGDILIGLICLRAYQLVYMLYWRSLEARELFYYELENVMSAPLYRLKAILQERPYQTISLLYLAILLLLAPVVRGAERSTAAAANLTLYDDVWSMAVTQSTVGYGDIVPRTNIGRATSICAALAGFFTNALMQTVALQRVRMSVGELQFVAAMGKKDNIPLQACAVLLQRWWRLVSARRRLYPQRFDLLLKYMNCVWTFRLLVRRNVSHDYLEFHQLLDNTNRRISLRFRNVKLRLRALKHCAKSLAKLSTAHSMLVSKLLWMKGCYKRMAELKQPQAPRQKIKMKSTLLTLQQRKHASENAYRRMLLFRFGQRSSTEKWIDSPRPDSDVVSAIVRSSWAVPS